MGGRVGDLTRPEHVVEDEEPVWPQPRQQLLVVGEVVGLVRVDEGQVERGRARQGAQRLEGGGEPERDPVGEARALPVALRDRRPLGVHVAAEKPTPGSEPAGDRDRAVAGEGPDLDGRARADEASKQREERPLLGRDLHHAYRPERRGLGGEVAEHVILGRVVSLEIGVERRRHHGELGPHGQTITARARRRKPPVDFAPRGGRESRRCRACG